MQRQMTAVARQMGALRSVQTAKKQNGARQHVVPVVQETFDLAEARQNPFGPYREYFKGNDYY